MPATAERRFVRFSERALPAGLVYPAEPTADGMWVVRNVPIMGTLPAGARGNEEPLGRDWLEAALKEFQAGEADGFLPPVHLEHHDLSAQGAHANRRIGFLRLTKVAPMSIAGKVQDTLFADIVVEKERDLELLIEGAYPFRSVQFPHAGVEARISSLALMNNEGPFFRFPLLNVEKKPTDADFERFERQLTEPAVLSYLSEGNGSAVLFDWTYAEAPLSTRLSRLGSRVATKNAETLARAHDLMDSGDEAGADKLVRELESQLKEPEKKPDKITVNVGGNGEGDGEDGDGEETDADSQNGDDATPPPNDDGEQAAEAPPTPPEDGTPPQAPPAPPPGAGTDEIAQRLDDLDAKIEQLTEVLGGVVAVLGAPPEPETEKGPIDTAPPEEEAQAMPEEAPTTDKPKEEKPNQLHDLQGQVAALREKERARERSDTITRLVDEKISALRTEGFNVSDDFASDCRDAIEHVPDDKLSDALDTFVAGVRRHMQPDPPTTLAAFERRGTATANSGRDGDDSTGDEGQGDEVQEVLSKYARMGPAASERAQIMLRNWRGHTARGGAQSFARYCEIMDRMDTQREQAAAERLAGMT